MQSDNFEFVFFFSKDFISEVLSYQQTKRARAALGLQLGMAEGASWNDERLMPK